MRLTSSGAGPPVVLWFSTNFWGSMEVLMSAIFAARVIPAQSLAVLFNSSGFKSERASFLSSNVLTTAPTILWDVLKGMLYFLTSRFDSSVVVE